jgi:hypothetical protein
VEKLNYDGATSAFVEWTQPMSSHNGSAINVDPSILGNPNNYSLTILTPRFWDTMEL